MTRWEKFLEFVLSIFEPAAGVVYKKRKLIGTVVKWLFTLFATGIIALMSLGLFKLLSKGGKFLAPHIPKWAWWTAYTIIGIIIVAMAVYIFSQLRKSRKEKREDKEPPEKEKDTKEKKSPDKKPVVSGFKWRWLVLTLIILALIGDIPSIIYLFKDKPEEKEEVWIKTTVAMLGSTKPAEVFNASISECKIWDTPTRFEMTCSNGNGRDIFRMEKNEPTGKWWRENEEDEVFGTFEINKDKYHPPGYTGITTTGTGRKSTMTISLQNK